MSETAISETHTVLFHHALGLTDGVRALGQRLAIPGVVVHTPDLYRGQVADDLEAGFDIKNEIGDETIADRVEEALADLPDQLVVAGVSLGVMSAQRLAQTRPGIIGALLYEACVPITGAWRFGPWPDDVPVQIHGMDNDQFFATEGDLDAARELVATVGPDRGELFTYPGDGHLFCDSSLPGYDQAATDLLIERSHRLLERARVQAKTEES